VSRKGAEGSELSFTELELADAEEVEAGAEPDAVPVAAEPEAEAMLVPCAMMEAATSGLIVEVLLAGAAELEPLDEEDERTIWPRV